MKGRQLYQLLELLPPSPMQVDRRDGYQYTNIDIIVYCAIIKRYLPIRYFRTRYFCDIFTCYKYRYFVAIPSHSVAYLRASSCPPVRRMSLKRIRPFSLSFFSCSSVAILHSCPFSFVYADDCFLFDCFLLSVDFSLGSLAPLPG